MGEKIKLIVAAAFGVMAGAAGSSILMARRLEEEVDGRVKGLEKTVGNLSQITAKHEDVYREWEQLSKIVSLREQAASVPSPSVNAEVTGKPDTDTDGPTDG
ncbi:MAG: hypothetical protein ACPG4T_03320 [Nannocystaceae bacterium]